MEKVGSFDVDGEDRLEAGRILAPLPSQRFRDTFSAAPTAFAICATTTPYEAQPVHLHLQFLIS